MFDGWRKCCAALFGAEKKIAPLSKIFLKSIAKSNKRIYLCSTKLNKHTLNKRNYGSND